MNTNELFNLFFAAGFALGFTYILFVLFIIPMAEFYVMDRGISKCLIKNKDAFVLLRKVATASAICLTIANLIAAYTV